MGNLYLFVELVVQLLLTKVGRSYGYDLATDLDRFALTDAETEVAPYTKPFDNWRGTEI